MSGELYPISGSKLYIGGRVSAKGLVSASDFTGASWTEIGGWANAGSVGDTQDVGEQALINEKRVRKFKTTLNGGTMENQFVPMALDPGQIKFRQAIEDCVPFQFKIEWGADCMPGGTVTFSIADPGVVTWTGHGLEAGQPVVFDTEDAMPGGLTKGTVYYVVTVPDADTFTVAATADAAVGIETTGTAAGVYTAAAPPIGMTDMFYGLALPGARQGGDATSVHLRNWSISVDSNIIEV